MPSAVHANPTAMEDDMVKPVAVVGMACRFPDDATSPDAFYEMLANGRAAWSEVPENRFKIDSYYHPNGGRVGTTQARGAHWMKEDPALFDAPVSSFSPRYRTILKLCAVLYVKLARHGHPSY